MLARQVEPAERAVAGSASDAALHGAVTASGEVGCGWRVMGGACGVLYSRVGCILLCDVPSPIGSCAVCSPSLRSQTATSPFLPPQVTHVRKSYFPTRLGNAALDPLR